MTTTQSTKPKNLISNPIAGLSASPCVLPGKGSTCMLTLTINGSAVPAEGIHGGPVLCQDGTLSECYEPTLPNRLNIRVSMLRVDLVFCLIKRLILFL